MLKQKWPYRAIVQITPFTLEPLFSPELMKVKSQDFFSPLQDTSPQKGRAEEVMDMNGETLGGCGESAPRKIPPGA